MPIDIKGQNIWIVTEVRASGERTTVYEESKSKAIKCVSNMLMNHNVKSVTVAMEFLDHSH